MPKTFKTKFDKADYYIIIVSLPTNFSGERKMYKITCQCGYIAITDGYGLSEAMTDLIKVGYIILDFKFEDKSLNDMMAER